MTSVANCLTDVLESLRARLPEVEREIARWHEVHQRIKELELTLTDADLQRDRWSYDTEIPLRVPGGTQG